MNSFCRNEGAANTLPSIDWLVEFPSVGERPEGGQEVPKLH